MGFFSSFTGGDQRRRAKSAHNREDAILRGAASRSDTAYDSAIGRLSAYDDNGAGAQDYETYRDLLGVNGADARGEAQGLIFDDPAYQRIAENNTNRLFRRFNANGASFSGAALQGANRLGTEQYENRLNRYRDLGQQGRSFGAGIAERLGGLDVGKATQRNAFEVGRAQSFNNLQGSLNQIGTQGVNNLLQLGGTALKAASGGFDPSSFASSFGG